MGKAHPPIVPGRSNLRRIYGASTAQGDGHTKMSPQWPLGPGGKVCDSLSGDSGQGPWRKLGQGGPCSARVLA